MKKVEIVRPNEVEVEPFELARFIVKDTASERSSRITKKEIRALADALGLAYSEAQIAFAKKIMNTYMGKEGE